MDKFLSEKVVLYQDEDIESLFKVEPPLEIMEGYHGYKGVILRNKVTDTIQCHICGEWLNFLPTHIRIKHGINAMEYRYKFGLPINHALCSVSHSEKMRKRALMPKNIENVKKMREKSQQTWNKAGAKRTDAYKQALKYGWKNPAKRNMIGACEEQIQRRFLIVADTVGREPSILDITEHDCSLMHHITRKYGTLNKFREKYGYKIVQMARNWNDSQLISSLRKMAKEKNRVPVAADFRNHFPSTNTFLNRFGSWRRAISMAGVSN